MESLNSIPVAVGFGILIGFVVGWFSRSGSGGKSQEMLKQSKDEMEQYRKDVTAHFEKTAMLVGAMTEQYRAVYDHLSDGAQNLCNDPTARLDVIGQGEALIAAHTAPEEGQNAKPVTAAVAPQEESPGEAATAAASSAAAATVGPEESSVAVEKGQGAAPTEERTAT